MATRPYGSGPYGTSVYGGTPVLEIGGLAQLAFDASGAMALAWRPPLQCSPGTWTLTQLPSLPPNDLELAA